MFGGGGKNLWKLSMRKPEQNAASVTKVERRGGTIPN